jgi:two-component system NtrC family response regulator
VSAPIDPARPGAGLEKLLVVDDDEQILNQIQWALGGEYRVFPAGDRPTALEIFRGEQVGVVLLDLGLPPHPREASEGLLALEEMLAENRLAKVVIVSGNAERHSAVRAVRLGACDIFPKPVDLDQLRVVLSRLFQRLLLEQEDCAASRDERVEFHGILGASPKMRAVFATIEKIAHTDVPVLVTGESGTGKEKVAAAIHQLSRRRQGPFIPLNCGAIPENLLESELFGHERGAFTGATAQRAGKLEYARRGTLFLDEIGELAPALQVKLLRFLQEKVIERVGGREAIEIDCRVLAATNQDLELAVEQNRFREDLYFRLAVVRIALPPLRERGGDVLLLAERFISAYSKELDRPLKALSAKAAEGLLRHSWPGNVRELQNCIKRAMVLSEGRSIGLADLELEPAAALAERPAADSSLKKAKESLERELVLRTLAGNRGNISRTARELGISRPTLYDLIDRYGLRRGAGGAKQ